MMVCRHKTVEYVQLIQRPAGFHVLGRCLGCGKIRIGKYAVGG